MEEKEIQKLLREYNKIMEKLASAGIIRGDNLVSEYGEYIVAKKLNLIRMRPSNPDYDAVSKDGTKYQIKTRKASSRATATMIPTGKIERLKKARFDFLLALFLDKDWNVRFLLKIPRRELKPNKYGWVSVNRKLIEKYNIWAKN